MLPAPDVDLAAIRKMITDGTQFFSKIENNRAPITTLTEMGEMAARELDHLYSPGKQDQAYHGKLFKYNTEKKAPDLKHLMSMVTNLLSHVERMGRAANRGDLVDDVVSNFRLESQGRVYTEREASAPRQGSKPNRTSSNSERVAGFGVNVAR